MLAQIATVARGAAGAGAAAPGGVADAATVGAAVAASATAGAPAAATWLQPLATVLGAIILGAAAFFTLRQKARADAAELRQFQVALAHQREVDRRESWWKRAQWAIDLSLSDQDASRLIGAQVMLLLSEEDVDGVDLALLLTASLQGVDIDHDVGHDGMADT